MHVLIRNSAVIAIILSMTRQLSFAETPGCELENFRACTEVTCNSSSGGPAGETPCCKPPPYRPQLCGAATLWLPTTVYYPAPESAYNESPDSGFAANQSFSGNYTKIGLNPGWVLFYGYGVTSCAPWVTLVGEPMSNPIFSKQSYTSSTWSKTPNKGHVKPLPDIGTNTPALTRSRVDDRLFASSYTLFYRGMTESPAPPTKFSFSPYAKKCFQPGARLYSSLNEYKRKSGKYGSFGEYLNRYNQGTFTSLERSLFGGSIPHFGPIPSGPGDGSGLFDQQCTEDVKLYKKRPIYFVYSKYYISVHKAGVQACR